MATLLLDLRTLLLDLTLPLEMATLLLDLRALLLDLTPPARPGPYPLSVDSPVSVRARLHCNSSDSIGRKSCTSMQLGRKCHVVLSSQLEPTWTLVPASHTSQFFRR